MTVSSDITYTQSTLCQADTLYNTHTHRERDGNAMHCTPTDRQTDRQTDSGVLYICVGMQQTSSLGRCPVQWYWLPAIHRPALMIDRCDSVCECCVPTAPSYTNTSATHQQHADHSTSNHFRLCSPLIVHNYSMSGGMWWDYWVCYWLYSVCRHHPADSTAKTDSTTNRLAAWLRYICNLHSGVL